MRLNKASVVCTMLVNDYVYISEFEPGPNGPQPHDFIIANGTNVGVIEYAVPDGYDNLNWFTIGLTFGLSLYDSKYGKYYKKFNRRDVVINIDAGFLVWRTHISTQIDH